MPVSSGLASKAASSAARFDGDLGGHVEAVFGKLVLPLGLQDQVVECDVQALGGALD